MDGQNVCPQTCGLCRKKHYTINMKPNGEGIQKDARFFKKKTITRFLIYSSILLAVDGSWGNWENWSVCTVTCGGGVRLRSRQCDNPAPLRGGVDCIGFAQEAGDCNAEECIGKSKTCVCYP